jgi:hypothetical protein
MLKEFEPLIQYYLGEFQKHGESALKTIRNLSVPSEIILMKYKTLPAIESLGEKEKKELKRYVIDMFPEKAIAEKLKACKIIYTIGTLL